jgi:mRNA interferase MazF
LAKPKRGQLWEVDFEPQTHKQEPGKRGRPALVIQTDILNDAGHATTIVIPCSTQVYRDNLGDGFPLRVSLGKIAKTGQLAQETDVLIDQIRTIANQRFMGVKAMAQLPHAQMKRVEEALRILTSA